jgi:hypothetical protein
MALSHDPAVSAKLEELVARDAEFGARAELRVAAKYGKDASMEVYHFSKSFARESQASQQIDWVHRGWLRPVRFAYRHATRWVRFAVKKAAS